MRTWKWKGPGEGKGGREERNKGAVESQGAGWVLKGGFLSL